jgi:predicted  nucleic acid-binding Zn-ribbon protein
MPGPAAILREIHRLRRHAKELQDKIAQLPRLLKAQQNKATREEEALRQAQEHLKHLKVTTHDKEVTLKTARQQIQKYEKQLEEAGSKKEYDSLKAEINSGREKAGRVEDGILETMLETEEQAAKIPALEKAVALAKEEVGRFEADLQARQQRLEEELRLALAGIAQVEATLPAGKVREEYDRLMKVRGDDALAMVENRTCAACYTEITPQQQHDLSQEHMILCKNCGRFLYLAE